jgi:hypothetical protein
MEEDDEMRIQVERDGGFGYFPGLNGPFTLDTESLPAADAVAVEAAAAAADFAAGSAPPDGSADMRTVTVEVDDGVAVRRVTVADPPADPALRDLVERVLAANPRKG